MKNKKFIVCALIIFIVGIAGGYIISSQNSNQRIVSGYAFDLIKENTITKKFDEDRLNSFVTIAEPQDKFEVNVEEINSSSDVFIINPMNGEREPMKYKDGKFVIETALDKDINYGIIMDYTLIGSIRVVEDIDTIDEDKLFTDILISLGCGL